MRKEIEVNGRKVALECNSATPLVMKRIFKFDFMTFVSNMSDYDIGDQLEKSEQVAYIMALMADHPLRDVLNMNADGFLEWLAGFEFVDMNSIIIPAAMELWTGNSETSSTPKNADGPQ